MEQRQATPPSLTEDTATTQRNMTMTTQQQNDDRTVAELARAWILSWDKATSDETFVFEDKFGDFYDWEAQDVMLYDDADPEHQLFRRVADYQAAFEPTFNQLKRAEHWLALEPEVVHSSDLASSYLIFLARLTTADDTLVCLRCTNALVWRRTSNGWRIVRDHTSSVALTPEEMEAAVVATGA